MKKGWEKALVKNYSMLSPRHFSRVSQCWLPHDYQRTDKTGLKIVLYQESENLNENSSDYPSK